VDDLVAPDEVELGERQDPVPVERRLEGEVEAGRIGAGTTTKNGDRQSTADFAANPRWRNQPVTVIRGAKL
jgi:hypothetical protein